MSLSNVIECVGGQTHKKLNKEISSQIHKKSNKEIASIFSFYITTDDLIIHNHNQNQTFPL